MFEVSGLYKMSDKDNWKEGCVGPGSSHHVDVSFKNEDLDALIKEIAAFVGIEEKDFDNSVERTACEEEGRIDFVVQENADGQVLTEQEWLDFKAGRIDTYYVTYVARVYEVQRKIADVSLPAVDQAVVAG